MVTFWLLIDTIAMIGSPAARGAAPSVVCSGRAWAGGGAGGAGRGVGGRSRSQRRQGGRGRERHNRRRCPSPDYLGGLGPRASTCHAMSGVREDPVETNTENGWMVPVIRPVVNRHFHVIRLTFCGLFVRCMSLVLAHRVIARRRSNSVAFGAKRTFSVPRLQYRIYEYAA